MSSLSRPGVRIAACTLLALAGAAGSAGAQGFTITAPPSGAQVAAGGSVTVQWTGGTPGWNVRIALVKKTPFVVIGNLVANVPNTGSRTVTMLNTPTVVCGHEYQVYIENIPKTTHAYGPWFKIVCGNYDIIVQKMKLGPNLYRIQVANAPPALPLPVGAQIQVQEFVPPGLTVTSASPPWVCTPPSGSGWAFLNCRYNVTAVVPPATMLPPLNLQTSGSSQWMNCFIGRLFVNNQAQPETTLANNYGCIP